MRKPAKGIGLAISAPGGSWQPRAEHADAAAGEVVPRSCADFVTQVHHEQLHRPEVTAATP